MMAPQDTVGSPPAALAAFLRGCERRGAVFAELQCGDPDRGDVALAAALRAFRGNAAALPMADWPVRFWSLLSAAPPLRTAAPDARWPGALSALAAAAPLDRAALLLRLAGGLQEADAADALGLDGAAYRDALARACPRDALGHPDAAAWRAVAEAIQTQLRELPPDRLAKLARLREDALAGTRRLCTRGRFTMIALDGEGTVAAPHFTARLAKPGYGLTAVAGRIKTLEPLFQRHLSRRQRLDDHATALHYHADLLVGVQICLACHRLRQSHPEVVAPVFDGKNGFGHEGLLV